MHADDPAAPEYVPAAQGRHALDDVAPTVTPYFPAAHPVHTLAPETLEYVPAEHTVHDVAPGALNVPGAQAGKDSCEKYPASATQALEPTGEEECSGQAKQVFPP